MKAKTYKSTNHWTAPQSLSTFGIPISNKLHKKYLGLEEFNFCKILEKFRFENKAVAFIPCFNTKVRNPVQKLELFYHVGNGGGIRHYATMFEVEQIDEKDSTQIDRLRAALQKVGFTDYVRGSSDFQLNYGDLFFPAVKTWNEYFKSNKIIAKKTEKRFVVNVFYKSIVFHALERNVNWQNFNYASRLYV